MILLVIVFIYAAIESPSYQSVGVLHYWSTLVLTSSIVILAALCMTRKLSSFDLVFWNFRNLSFYLQEEPYIFDTFDNSLTQKLRKSLL
jgi:hypothetical protein